MDFLKWWFELVKAGHWFFALLVLCAVYYSVKSVVYYLPQRVSRTIVMAKYGYPPAHCDADGDAVEEDKFPVDKQ